MDLDPHRRPWPSFCPFSPEGWRLSGPSDRPVLCHDRYRSLGAQPIMAHWVRGGLIPAWRLVDQDHGETLLGYVPRHHTLLKDLDQALGLDAHACITQWVRWFQAWVLRHGGTGGWMVQNYEPQLCASGEWHPAIRLPSVAWTQYRVQTFPLCVANTNDRGELAVLSIDAVRIPEPISCHDRLELLAMKLPSCFDHTDPS